MSINLSNLNISLQQFQSISSGKYNAGEVKLASETKLGRINNHVHLTGSNAKPLSHEEVLARFVTGRGDATYAALNAAEKTKVHVVMSLLTQESSTAVIEVPATALHPEEKKATFAFGGNGGALTRSFRLEQDAAGGITVRFETTVRPSNLVVDGDLVPLGAGSSISGGYALTLSAELLGALGNLDFTTCDLGPADQVLTSNPPVARKLRTAVNQLPPAFQLDLQPTTTLSFVLN